MTNTVPRAKRPDATLNKSIREIHSGNLSVASGRFTLGTILGASRLGKTEPLCKAQLVHA